MPDLASLRVGYVVKRYPRFSETFIVNEILAHEEAGQEIEIFSLRAPNDTHFQDRIALVRAPVTYFPTDGIRASDLWAAMNAAAATLPQLWSNLEAAQGEDSLDVFQALQLAVAVQAKGIQHLHAHFATSATAVARLASRFAGITYSVTAHAKDIFHETAEVRDLTTKLADAAAAVTVSDYNVAYLRKLLPGGTGRLQRLYNGLDLRDFPFTSPMDRGARIVAVGRLVEKKGFDCLIEACSILRRSRDFRCEIIGTGELAGELQAHVMRLGLQQTVALVGPRPRAEVAERMRGAAALAAPCVVGADGNRDGLPTVLLEAMALGTPCVATDIVGIPELVRDGQTGLLTPERDPPALAAALQRLLDDGALRVQLASGARRLIEEEFDIHRNAQTLRDLFRRAVSNNSGARAATEVVRR